MSNICRTCLLVMGNPYIDFNLHPFAKKQLALCIPELDCDLVLDPVICSKCAKALEAAHDFKTSCLRTEQRIHAYAQTATIEQNLTLDAVLGNSVINLIEMHSISADTTNDLNTINDHFKTIQNLENHSYTSEECFGTNDNYLEMASNATVGEWDDVKLNYDSIKKEKIEIGQFEDNNCIASSSGISCSLQPKSEFDNGFNLESQEDDRSSSVQDIDSREQFEGVSLFQQCSKSSSANHTATIQNNSSSTCAHSSIKQGRAVAESSEIPINMKLKKSSSVGLLQQCNVNATIIVDIDQHEVMNGKKTDDNKSNYRKCGTSDIDVNLKNNATATEAQVEINTVADQPPVHLNLQSKSQEDGMEFVETVVGKSYKCASCDYIALYESSLRVHMTTHSGEKPYKCNICDYAGSQKSLLKSHMVRHTEGKPYKCSFCDSAFRHRATLRKHMKNHSGDKSYKCNVCDYASSGKDFLKLHLRTHRKKPYKCNSCEFVTSNKSSLTCHMRMHPEEKNYKCNRCDYAGSQESLLIRHMVRHTGDKPYKCSSCDSAFWARTSLKTHMMKHTGDKPYKCSSCDSAFWHRTSLKTHMMKHTGDKPYKCNICDHSFSRKDLLKLHLMTHTGEKPYKCNSCEFAATNKSNLSAHMRIHAGEKPYKCNRCDYAGSQESLLIRHMVRHTGDKPYKCSSCDSAFRHRASLRKHMMNHTGDKPYKCNVCDHSFSTRDLFKFHLMTHTGEKPHKCNLCDYAVTRKYLLKSHMRTHTGDKPFKCNICDYAFFHKDQLRLHILRTHSGEYKCKAS